MAQFFITTQIAAEADLQSEIESVWFLLLDLDGLPTRSSLPDMNLIPGGIEMDVPIHLALQLNFFLRLANRVLYRLEGFKARYYDQFEKSLTSLKLKAVLDEKEKIRLSISHHKSRLNHEKNLIESASRALKKQGYVVDSSVLDASVNAESQTLFIRIDSDFVTVSLDSSGVHLHRRGYRTEQGEAPIRETLAALMWAKIRKYYHEQEIQEPRQVVDPFCGSGTVLTEGFLNSKLNSKRSYAFQTWKTIPAIMKSSTFFQNYFWMKTTEASSKTIRSEKVVLGIDLDANTLEKAVRNAKRCEEMFQTPVAIEYTASNCATASLKIANSPTLIITNPPYGERLSSVDTVNDLVQFLKNNRVDQTDLFLLLPLGKTPKIPGFNSTVSFQFNNQGLKLNLLGFTNRK